MAGCRNLHSKVSFMSVVLLCQLQLNNSPIFLGHSPLFVFDYHCHFTCAILHLCTPVPHHTCVHLCTLCGCLQQSCTCTMHASSIIFFMTSDWFPLVSRLSIFWHRAWSWAARIATNAPGNIWGQMNWTGLVGLGCLCLCFVWVN